MALSNHILTIIEPSIKLDEYSVLSFKEEEGQSNISDGLGAETPLVIVNGYVQSEQHIYNNICMHPDPFIMFQSQK